MVENSPFNAGDAGLIPGWGNGIPQAMGQLNPRATTQEPGYCNKDPTWSNQDLAQPDT